MNTGLELGAAEMRALGTAAVEWMVRYYSTLPERRVMPDTTSRHIRALVDEPLPQSGSDAARLLEIVENCIVPLSRQNGHPRFFGYVGSPGTAITSIGDLLASTLNANVTSWRSAPGPAEIERVAVNWIKEILGYPQEAAGLFVSGGSMANLSGLAAARSRYAPDCVQAGLGSQPRLRIYVSEEGHFSIRKAAGLLGIGQDHVRTIRTDEQFRIDLGDLERCIEEDRAAGYVPASIVANAGAVATGAFDPIEELAAIARRHGMWLHVDGAYGGFAALAGSARPLFRGISEADSVSLDPHKWLYVSMGCGCVLYRDPAAASRAFGYQAEYTRPLGLESDEAFAFWDYGPELSRRFRALNVWLLIKYAGARALSAAIERNIACAKHLERLVEAAPDFEMLAPVGLSIACFRYVPPRFTGDLDALNERVLIELQRQGRSYVSNARPKGRFALRACIVNYRTTEQDVEILLEDVRRAAAVVLAS